RRGRQFHIRSLRPPPRSPPRPRVVASGGGRVPGNPLFDFRTRLAARAEGWKGPLVATCITGTPRSLRPCRQSARCFGVGSAAKKEISSDGSCPSRQNRRRRSPERLHLWRLLKISRGRPACLTAKEPSLDLPQLHLIAIGQLAPDSRSRVQRAFLKCSRAYSASCAAAKSGGLGFKAAPGRSSRSIDGKLPIRAMSATWSMPCGHISESTNELRHASRLSDMHRRRRSGSERSSAERAHDQAGRDLRVEVRR